MIEACERHCGFGPGHMGRTAAQRKEAVASRAGGSEAPRGRTSWGRAGGDPRASPAEGPHKRSGTADRPRGRGYRLSRDAEFHEAPDRIDWACSGLGEGEGDLEKA
ncbi:hypothetical protein MPTK1_5g02700 [Marchantia polymorpha subsp. ruderalis]|uniref:Uncharacterized protein n=2 Tax=Marchantia polymorpha TaxID=3197 RepID=A0AAF6BE97_MARPO|nr:hypothetical protein MARPO_0124s0053 [Marchantia polymorpha]BBN10331.1 hypothetical protein Mp_5g02700 [Marchantia polymorpha subsp. ruderalis]|eukprot:PTQ30487.1 hypothetical protein MARPO_0124s0053 [Marchantia polymorpha]